MAFSEFNSDFVSDLRERLPREKNKDKVLMADFNLDLLKYQIDINTANFLDQIFTTVDRNTSNKRSYKNKCKIKNINLQ